VLLATGGAGFLTGFQYTPWGDPSPTAPSTAGVSGAREPAAGTAAPSAIDWSRTDFTIDQIAPSFYTLTGLAGVDPGHPDGAGGRVGVLVEDDGLLLVVDASYLPVADKLVTAIRSISAAPFRYLVNTHSHPDHTGGNPVLAKLGAVLLAREAARNQLLEPLPSAAGDAADRSDPAGLPTVTYGLGEPMTIRLQTETVQPVPVAPAHTSGDTIVRFDNAEVMMIGDFYRNYGYPFVDPSNGGTMGGILDALELTMRLSESTTRLIPWHGTRITRADLVPYRDMIMDVQQRARDLIEQGHILPAVLSARLTAPYDQQVPGALDLTLGMTTADRFVSAVYADLRPS
jgi:glyoxylase-like metal-dependent hydrolase (beta-lactamase superfamily II)